MKLHDTPGAYGAISRVNHWLGALLVLAVLALGIYFHEMPRGDERLYWMRLHVGIGMVALLPLLFRIGWRVASRSPEPLAQPRPLQWLTRTIHWGLLGLMAVLLVSGPLVVWSLGRPIDIFGLVALSSPLGEMATLHEALEVGHAVAGKAMLPLIALHVLGAMKHLVLERDRALGRLIGRPRLPA